MSIAHDEVTNARVNFGPDTRPAVGLVVVEHPEREYMIFVEKGWVPLAPNGNSEDERAG